MTDISILASDDTTTPVHVFHDIEFLSKNDTLREDIEMMFEQNDDNDIIHPPLLSQSSSSIPETTTSISTTLTYKFTGENSNHKQIYFESRFC